VLGIASPPWISSLAPAPESVTTPTFAAEKAIPPDEAAAAPGHPGDSDARGNTMPVGVAKVDITPKQERQSLEAGWLHIRNKPHLSWQVKIRSSATS
jgi:hypothetical protein